MGRILHVFGWTDAHGVEHIIETQLTDKPPDPPELYLKATKRGINFSRVDDEDHLKEAVAEGRMVGEVDPVFATFSDPFSAFTAPTAAKDEPKPERSATDALRAAAVSAALRVTNPPKPEPAHEAAKAGGATFFPEPIAPTPPREPVTSPDLSARVKPAKTSADAETGSVQLPASLGGGSSEAPGRPTRRRLSEHTSDQE